MPISASFPTSSSAPTSKNVYLQQIHVLNVCQSPRPSNPELGRCISETRFCYLGRVRFDDSIGSHFQPPVWRKRVHMNLRVPKCRRGEGMARTQYPFYPLDASRCNERLPIFFFHLVFTFLTNCESFGLCLSVPNNKIDERCSGDCRAVGFISRMRRRPDLREFPHHFSFQFNAA